MRCFTRRDAFCDLSLQHKFKVFKMSDPPIHVLPSEVPRVLVSPLVISDIDHISLLENIPRIGKLRLRVSLCQWQVTGVSSLSVLHCLPSPLSHHPSQKDFLNFAQGTYTHHTDSLGSLLMKINQQLSYNSWRPHCLLIDLDDQQSDIWVL